MPAEVDLIEALKGERDHRLVLQRLLVAYLGCDINSEQFVSRTAWLLDGPEQRSLEANTKAALREAA